MTVLNEYGLIGGAFLLPPQEDDGNLPRDKIPGEPGKTVKLTNMGSPIRPRWYSLFNIIFLFTHLFCYLNKMATISRYVLLLLLINMERKWHTTQVISSS